MDSSTKSNTISDIVKLKRMLKKWRTQASSSTNGTSTGDSNNGSNKSSSNNSKKGSLSRSNSVKGIKFLKRTLSFNDLSASGTSSSTAVPKGFLAVHVGEEMKRFVIPTNYLSHQAFSTLLKDAEEEFGFQQEGILRIPCEEEEFKSILKVVEAKKQALKLSRKDGIVCGPSETQSLSHSHHPPSPMCR